MITFINHAMFKLTPLCTMISSYPLASLLITLYFLITILFAVLDINPIIGLFYSQSLKLSKFSPLKFTLLPFIGTLLCCALYYYFNILHSVLVFIIGLLLALLPLLSLCVYFLLWYVTFRLHHHCYLQSQIAISNYYASRIRTQSSKKLKNRGARKFQRRYISSQSIISQINRIGSDVDMAKKDIATTVSIIEAVFILSYQLADASSHKMKVIAVAAFVKSINGGESLCIDILKKIESAFGDKTESQAFIDYVNTGKDSHDKFKSLLQSPGMTKIYTFIMYVLSLGLFAKAGLSLSSIGYSRVEEAALKRQHNSKLGFADSLVEMTLFLCTAGYQAYQGMSIDHIVHSPDAYGKFYDDVEIYVQDFLRYEATNAGAGVEHTNLLDRLAKLLQQYKEIETISSRLTKLDRKILITVRGKLLSCEAKLKNEKICQSSRPAPFSLLLAGPSGIGKSILSEIFFAQFGKRRNLSIESEMKYVRSPTQEFWDNFDPKMWCLILDDIAWQHPKSGTIDQSVSELLHLINNVPYVTNQASLEKKGTTPFLGQFVLGTTNTRDLSAANYFNYPAAARRRFPLLLDVSVKKEYANAHGNLVVNSNTAFPDYWTFKVTEIKAQGRTIVENVVLQTESIGCLLTWFNSEVDQFYERQGRAMSSVDDIHRATLCETCGIPEILCPCSSYEGENPHSYEMDSSYLFDTIEAQSVVTNIENSFLIMFYIFIIKAVCATYLPQLSTWLVRKFISVALYDLIDMIQLMFYRITNQQRKALCLIGARVKRRIIKTPQIFIIIAGVLGVGIAIRYLLPTTESQGNIIPMTRERQDYYYSDQVEVTKFDGSLKSRCVDFTSLKNRVSQNVLYAEIDDITSTTRCRLLGVVGNLYLTNSHSIPHNPKEILARMGVDRNGVTMERLMRISESDVYRDIPNDLAIIRLPGLPPRKDITEFFLESRPAGNAEGLYLDRSENGQLLTNEMKHITYGSKHVPDLKKDLFCATSYVSTPTVGGQCGMPLLAQCGQNKSILGIHSVGGTIGGSQFAGSTVVTKPMLFNLLSHFDDTVDTIEPSLSSQSVTRTLGGLHPRSVFRYIEDGAATLHGSFLGFRPEPRSSVCKTPINAAMAERNITTDCTKPVMSGWRPWRIAALGLVDPVTQIDSAIVRECGDAYFDDVIAKVPDSAIKKMLTKYDEFTSLNGCEGIAFLDGIKRNTSAGAPFGRSKKHYIEKTEPQRNLMDPIKLTSEMSNRVQKVRDTYANGVRYQPVFTAHLKDEAVSAKKAQEGKTRVFCGAPFDWSVVVRELFLSHVRLIQNYKIEFECGVGTVAPSTEWGDLYKHITQFGEDRIIAGDYKAYDKRMPPVLMLEAFRILIRLAEHSENFTKEDIRAMWCVAYDTCYPLVDFNGDLVTFWGSNPSGHPLTVIINSIVNSLYVRYTFNVSGHDVSTFSDNVSLLTYGDDNIMGVNPKCVGFDHTVIQNQLGNIGVVYTMADKESESVPFVHIKDANFLKRSWLFNAKEGVYTAPLEEASIHKMLCVYVKSKTITASEQITEIIRSAQREWWHYGEEIFEEKTLMLKEVIQECDLTTYFEERPLCTYEYLWEQFYECSAKTKSIL